LRSVAATTVTGSLAQSVDSIKGIAAATTLSYYLLFIKYMKPLHSPAGDIAG
jgi:hypothetical protein